MPPFAAPWLGLHPPWLVSVPPSLCAGLPVVPEQVPVVEVLGAPCTLAEVVALRVGRYVPLFGRGQSREEAVRAMANIARVLGPGADPRGTEHALSLAVHPVVGSAPLRALAQGALDGSAAPCWSDAVLAYVGVLGAGDALREQVARDLLGPPHLAIELALAQGAGGGDLGTFREHYAALAACQQSEAAPVRVVRAWFDFVLARRFAALDALRALREYSQLDAASLWLIASADLIAGGERARSAMAETAETLLGPVRFIVPRLVGTVAREMAELVRHSLSLRFAHLRCAAARDHAAMAIRAWLAAAVEPEIDEAILDTDVRALGPEPSHAGRSAINAPAAAGEFLLDWFVPDREARDAVDKFARRVLQLYHRLRGAQLLARVERELRPPGGMLTSLEMVVWGVARER